MKRLMIAMLPLLGPAVPDTASAAVPVTIAERYVTDPDPEANIDSVSVAPAHGDRPALLFATAKKTDVVKVFDAANGRALGEIGREAGAENGFLRPNGVAVADGLLVVVERDNHRVSVRSIPDYRVLSTFGADRLRKPYGLWLQPLRGGRYRLFVTDAYEMPDESVPPNEMLGERVKSWMLEVEHGADGSPSSVGSRFEKSFGETTSPGALRVVESIFGDPAHGRLLIAEEDEDPGTGLVVKVYNLDGQFTGRQIGKGVFRAQAEGIALYACDDGSGYWISTDQDDDRSVYHLFDRKTLRHAGAFTGRVTANTDGIWFALEGVPGFGEGAFFAVHDDRAVSAFDWGDVVRALDLDACD